MEQNGNERLDHFLGGSIPSTITQHDPRLSQPGRGYHRRILKADLSTGSLDVEEVDYSFCRTYLGGWGFALYYLLKEMRPGVDPLGPDNLLIFATGPLTGQTLGGTGRHVVSGKSPLTGGFAGSEAGGFWGNEFKRAGFDAVVVRGQAENPVYLWIHDGEAELRDGSNLWGRPTADVEDAIRGELRDRGIRIAQAGPAGENLVRFACVMHDVNRAAGRGGLGAVMGSKRLKAIAVRGRRAPSVDNPDKVKEYQRWLNENWPNLWPGTAHHDKGTLQGQRSRNAVGDQPTRNWQAGSIEGIEKITAERLRDTLLVDRATCYACPIVCKRVVESHDRYDVDPRYGGPEYEGFNALGTVCGVVDLEATCYAHQLCNAYGLDTISAGLTIAFAMECFERGLLTPETAGGLELQFGNPDHVIQALNLIARREGFGDQLAEGSYRLAQKIGLGAEKFCMTSKGQEIAIYDSRSRPGQALGWCMSPTGADHVHNIEDDVLTTRPRLTFIAEQLGIIDPLPKEGLSPQKVRAYIYWSQLQMMTNCLSVCVFLPWRHDLHRLQDIMRAVTGWNITAWELREMGERIWNLAEVFNVRENAWPSGGAMPERFYEPIQSGPQAGKRLSREAIEEARQTFFRMMDWDPETGRPNEGKLEQLNIRWALDHLE